MRLAAVALLPGSVRDGLYIVCSSAPSSARRCRRVSHLRVLERALVRALSERARPAAHGGPVARIASCVLLPSWWVLFRAAVPVLHRSAKRRCVVTEPAPRCGAGLQAVCSSLRCACRSPRAVSPSILWRSSSRHPPALRVRAACAASPRGPPLLRCASRCSVAFRVASALRRATRPASRRSCCSRRITTACACVRCGARWSMRVWGSDARPPFAHLRRPSSGCRWRPAPRIRGEGRWHPCRPCVYVRTRRPLRACIYRCPARVRQPSAAARPGDAAGGARPCCKRARESLHLVLSYSAAGRSWRGWSRALLLVAHPLCPLHRNLARAGDIAPRPSLRMRRCPVRRCGSPLEAMCPTTATLRPVSTSPATVSGAAWPSTTKGLG